ncbi:hypothetical protein M0R45_019332 [Rubus argutus]|uniref:Uncharacterized protein n=1 Tax=Rubus argutus TaxID=59490 RepID=A0AAW1X5W6_RUBAR
MCVDLCPRRRSLSLPLTSSNHGVASAINLPSRHYPRNSLARASLTPSLISAGCSFSRRNHLTGAITASHQASNSSRCDPISLSPHDLSCGRIEE